MLDRPLRIGNERSNSSAEADPILTVHFTCLPNPVAPSSLIHDVHLPNPLPSPPGSTLLIRPILFSPVHIAYLVVEEYKNNLSMTVKWQQKYKEKLKINDNIVSKKLRQDCHFFGITKK